MSKMKIKVHEARKTLLWADENVAINDGGEGILVNPDNGQTYYTAMAAIRIADSIRGWHIPTKKEVGSLSTREARKLNLPCNGKYNPYSKKFEYVGINGIYWTSTSNSDYYTWSLHTTSDGTAMVTADADNSYLSLRLVKD